MSLLLKTEYQFEHSTYSTQRSYFPNYCHPLENKNGEFFICKDNKIKIFEKNLRKNNLFEFVNTVKNNEENSSKKNSIFISSLKQIKNGKVLCCYKDLYIFTIKSCKIRNKEKIEFPNDECAVETIELKNGKILVITYNSLYEIKFIKEKYEISKLMAIPEDCIIKQKELNWRTRHNDFMQYINVYELPNNKLLIHFNSTQLIYGKCGTHPPGEICDNKIYILNLDNFELINLESFIGESNFAILKKYIVLIKNGVLFIFDIYNYKLIREIKDKFHKDYIINYNENCIVAISKFEKENDIILYDFTNTDNIKFSIFKGEFMKFIEKTYNCYNDVRAKNKIIYKLKNNSILILCNGKIYIVQIPENSFEFKPLNEIEYGKRKLE